MNFLCSMFLCTISHFLLIHFLLSSYDIIIVHGITFLDNETSSYTSFSDDGTVVIYIIMQTSLIIFLTVWISVPSLGLVQVGEPEIPDGGVNQEK